LAKELYEAYEPLLKSGQMRKPMWSKALKAIRDFRYTSKPTRSRKSRCAARCLCRGRRRPSDRSIQTGCSGILRCGLQQRLLHRRPGELQSKHDRGAGSGYQELERSSMGILQPASTASGSDFSSGREGSPFMPNIEQKVRPK
jgi:hypothetical protein